VLGGGTQVVYGTAVATTAASGGVQVVYGSAAGTTVSNDDAMASLGKARQTRLDLSLITRALQCRQAGADPDSLFAERTTLPSQVDACAALLAGPAPQT
jgi:hypothetical protein